VPYVLANSIKEGSLVIDVSLGASILPRLSDGNQAVDFQEKSQQRNYSLVTYVSRLIHLSNQIVQRIQLSTNLFFAQSYLISECKLEEYSSLYMPQNAAAQMPIKQASGRAARADAHCGP
jgi:hypothetical protein